MTVFSHPPQSSADWIAYFRANAAALLSVPWHEGAGITDAERAAITSSVQAFQLGESGEGHHIFHCAREYIASGGDAEYLPALRLFIAEEQRHGRDLARFLTMAGVPLIQKTWTDSLFRWLRHQAGLDLSITVLVAAEVIALIYYEALRNATGSAVLRRLCDQILSDEVAHIRFQSERLALIRQHRAGWQIPFINGWQRFLFTGICLAVWWTHGRVYRTGGFGFRRFWRESWRAMEHSLRLMDPRAYSFVSAEAEAEMVVEREQEPVGV
ncbi:hypothetical protein AYO44_14905 [Planctomycetaceae bacterium SCGC AG-212-F19]|nr:hypothetical protein AYO44_14905 [Planctomycetaceae bacterium SCGC AG-212-F19]